MTKKTSILLIVLITISISCNQRKIINSKVGTSETIVIRILSEKKLEINGQEDSRKNIISKVENFIKNDLEDNQVVVKVTNGADYHFYLKTSNLIREIYYEERNKESLKRFGKSFEKLEKSKQEEIKNDIPLNLNIEYE